MNKEKLAPDRRLEGPAATYQLGTFNNIESRKNKGPSFEGPPMKRFDEQSPADLIISSDKQAQRSNIRRNNPSISPAIIEAQLTRQKEPILHFKSPSCP